MIKNKKGIQLNQAFTAVLIVVLVAVLVIVGIFLLATLQTSLPEQAGDTEINESFTNVTNLTAKTLSKAPLCNANDFAVSAVNIRNVSGTFDVGATNYTVGAAAGTIIGTAGMSPQFNGEGWNVTYGYNYGGEACNATTTMITQFATYPALVGLVGTIVFLGLVIGVLVGSFVFGRREGI